MGTKSVFLWGPGFPVLSRRIARRVSSLIWAELDEKPAVVGKCYSKKLNNQQCHCHRRSNVFGDERFRFCPNLTKFSQI